MKKIPSIFMRDFQGDPSLVTREPNPECAWVFAGEGHATRKIDGTACMARDGKLYARYDAKKGKTPPPDFEAAQPEPDPVTGHWPGWVPVTDAPQFKWHREAWGRVWHQTFHTTLELVGPKVQGNPEGRTEHVLIGHFEPGLVIADDVAPRRDFDGLKAWLAENVMEGIVWHHPDGRMAKIKRTDFGLEWPVRAKS